MPGASSASLRFSAPSRRRRKPVRSARSSTSTSARSSRPSTPSPGLSSNSEEDYDWSSPSSIGSTASTSVKGKQRMTTCYDRCDAAISMETHSRTAEEALKSENLCEEWEDWEGDSPKEGLGLVHGDLGFDLDSFLHALQRHVGMVTGFARFAQGVYHQVFVVKTSDDRLFAARLDRQTDDGARQRLVREIATMQMAADAGVPVPRIVAHNADAPQAEPPWLLMDWVHGVDRPWAYLSEKFKREHLRQLACVMAKIFEAPVAEMPSSEHRIGSIARYQGGRCSIEPSDHLVPAPTQSLIDHPDSLESLLDWLCERATHTAAGTDHGALSLLESKRLVERFRPLLKDALEECDEGLSLDEKGSLRRITLMHGDADRNVLCLKGSPVVNAVIDWEFAWCGPAVLAAQYPVSISDEGIRNAQFHVADCDLLRGMVWEEKRDKRANLQEVFVQAMEAVSPVYALALRRGRRLRELVDWLLNFEHDDAYLVPRASFQLAKLNAHGL